MPAMYLGCPGAKAAPHACHCSAVLVPAPPTLGAGYVSTASPVVARCKNLTFCCCALLHVDSVTP